MSAPPLESLGLLIGLSFFFGFAFEDFHAASPGRQPGGVRTFPLLAIAGGALYLLDPKSLLPLVAGLVMLGAWLFGYYRKQVAASAAEGSGELVVPICNLLAFLLGPLALAAPPWLAIGFTVVPVLLLTARERLHALARTVALREVVTAAQFLILTGLVLPLLPDTPVTTLTALTPYKAWLALLAVCTISYGSYLVRRYLAPGAGDLVTAALGGLYSSTATTVVLARRAGANPAALPRAEAGIILATALMYPRILVIIAVFNPELARTLAPALLGLSLVGLLLAFWQYRRARAHPGGAPADAAAETEQRNPLELSAAAVFAVAFVVISIASSFVKARFGEAGIDVLAAIVGITDIDPFVLSLAQGVAAPLSTVGAAAAVLIAATSNNLLKASYAAGFAGLGRSLPAVAALLLLAAGGLAVALAMIFWGR